MADRTVDVVYGLSGQTIETYPPEWSEGVPSSATAAVYDGTRSNDDTADFTPSVTVDAVSTTVDVASGYSQLNKRKASLAATTDIVVGREYLIANADGQRELVTPTRVVSGDYVELDSDLAHDYPITTSTFKGLRMTFPVDNTWVATETNILLPSTPSYRVIWSYTVNSIVRRHYTYLRLVRQVAKHGVSIDSLKECWPDLQSEEVSEMRGQQFRYAIDAAYDRFRADVIASGLRPEQIRDTEIVDELVRAMTFYIIGAKMGISPGGRDLESWVAESRDDYDRLFNKTINATLKVAIDEGAEGATAAAPTPKIWFNR